jgi:hypothetical protein
VLAFCVLYQLRKHLSFSPAGHSKLFAFAPWPCQKGMATHNLLGDLHGPPTNWPLTGGLGERECQLLRGSFPTQIYFWVKVGSTRSVG